MAEEKNKHEGCEKGFFRATNAWYNRQLDKIEIQIGMYHPEGGTTGEFAVVWDKLGNELVPLLRAYDDSWEVLHLFSDIIAKMAEVDSKNISEEEFAQMLIDLGYKDLTKIEPPTEDGVKPQNFITVRIPESKARELGLTEKVVDNK